MRCIYCNFEKTEVIETRDNSDGQVVRRRRQCLDCKRRFTTYERSERFDLKVIKKSGAVEDFDKEKIKDSLFKSCKGQNITDLTILQLADQIVDELLSRKKSEIQTKAVAKSIMKKLLKLDEVAFVRFASYQYDVDSAEDFEVLKERATKDMGV